MKSNELLKKLFKQSGFKSIASEIGLTVSALYAWCDADCGKSHGTLNPLERILNIIRASGSLEPLHWLCQQCGGFFVPNPPARKLSRKDLLQEISRLQSELAGLQQQLAVAAADGVISAPETEALVSAWERLKPLAASFLLACQQGLFFTFMLLWSHLSPDAEILATASA